MVTWIVHTIPEISATYANTTMCINNAFRSTQILHICLGLHGDKQYVCGIKTINYIEETAGFKREHSVNIYQILLYCVINGMYNVRLDLH